MNGDQQHLALAKAAGEQTPTTRAHLCVADNCRTLTFDLYCWRHRIPKPAGEWAISDQVRNESEQENER